MLTILLEREQGMGMVIELVVVTRNNITIDRYQFQHSLNLFSLEAATLRYEHL